MVSCRFRGFWRCQWQGCWFDDFLSLDPTTGSGRVIGSIGLQGVNALTVASDGVVYGAQGEGQFFTINKATGRATLIGKYGPGMGSAGDLAFRDDGVLFATITRDGYDNTWLGVVNLRNGTATLLGSIGYPEVWGLSFRNGELYGVSNKGYVLRINPRTGAGTQIARTSATYWGLSTSGPALTGSITTPRDNTTMGLATIQVSAEARYDGGNGVKQVEFFVLYNGVWHAIGTDVSTPYATSWEMPRVLPSQQLKFRIDVVGNDGRRAEFAGGTRQVNLVLSAGDPAVMERWVPNRAYLNQRSLSPNGDGKCNVASMAMVLAMAGLIGRDYQSMAAKANEMYPQVLNAAGDPTVGLMKAELVRQGVEAEYTNGWSAEKAWPFYKKEIDAGRPVILNSRPTIQTDYGHFVVGVGYQENAREGWRRLIAYDPFGRWVGKVCSELGTGCPGNYDRNTLEATSAKGQWVVYDFDRFFVTNEAYLITAKRPGAKSLEVAELDAPDATSAEPVDIGTYAGVRTMVAQVALPLISRGWGTGTAELVNGDMELGRMGWGEYSSHGWPMIYRASELPVPPHGGEWGAWLGGDDDETSYIEQMVRVPKERPYLRYWHWIRSGENGCSWDIADVSVDGRVVDSYGLCNAANTEGWAPRIVDLSAYGGAFVGLRLRVETDSSVTSSLYIDDVAFQASPSVLKTGAGEGRSGPVGAATKVKR